jgi:ankyrin repeat protein
MTFLEAIRVIKKGDLVRVRHELNAGLDPNLSNDFESTILMLAAMEGNTALGRLLIEKGAELDRENKLHDSALSLAAMLGHSGFVKLLPDSGASLEQLKKRGTLESFLDWVETNCKVTSAEMSKMRLLLTVARDTTPDSILNPDHD